jgi:D-threonate/D-erythronate kinase
MQALALADDLTGALETGALMVAEGVTCAVAVSGPFDATASSAVLNVATRHVSAEEATRIVRAAVSRRPPYVFLKTDSTLRGRIAESLAALRAEFPERALVYVPAYPALGRTVRGGVLYVDGVPLAGTAFARDPLNPVRESSIRAVLGGVAGEIEIIDGECEADLARAVERFRARPAIVAGTAAMARYWARTLPVERRAATPALPRVRGGLIVCGSRYPVSRAQTATAANLAEWKTLSPADELRGDPLKVAAQLGEDVRALIGREAIEAMVVLGGDTALAILQALGCRVAHPLGEVLPGVPVSRIHVFGRALTLVTKAGGFGDNRTLLAVIRELA